MSKFYVFDLPAQILDGIQAFKVDFDTEEPASKTLLDQEPYHESDSSLSSVTSSSDDEDIYEVTQPPKGAFSVSVTQYNNEYEGNSFKEWQWVNRAHITGSPFVFFVNPTSSLIPDKKALSIYKSWFDQNEIVHNPVPELLSVQRNSELHSNNRKSAILLLGSGNFAGAIIDHQRLNHKTNFSDPLQNVKIIESKTFHRYTTRRKQGGAQSAKDNATGKANSAGSSIRRANERHLQEEIRSLLESWSPHLKDCYRIFIRAPGRSNRKLLVGYPNAPLGSEDSRIFTVPFSTSRPTLKECKSVWYQLTQASIVAEPEPPTIEAKINTSAKNVKETTTNKEVLSEVSPEEALTNRIVDLIRKSKLPALRALLLDEAEGNWNYALKPARKYIAFPTPLLYAAHFDKHTVVSALLSWGADLMIPTSTNLYIGDIAPKKTSETLQVIRKDMGESVFNWSKAKVGKPRSREEILSEQLQEKIRLKAELEAKEKEQEEQERKQKMERLIAKHGSGKLTGGLYEASRGLSEADLRQVERERRARAAESRLAKLNR